MTNIIDELSLSTTVFGREKQPDDLLRFLETTLAAGFKYVELSRKHFDLAKRAEVILSTGVKVWSVHGLLDGRGVADDESVRCKMFEEESSRIREAAVFGKVPYVVHYLNRMNDPLYGRYFMEMIEQLYAVSHSSGVILTIETVPYKPKVNERYADSREVADFVRSFKADDLLMTIDINHSNLREDLLEVCANADGLIANVHMSNNHGEWEDHLPPYDGVIDFEATFAALREHGYCGPANLEMHGPETITVDWLKEIRKYTEEKLFTKD